MTSNSNTDLKELIEHARTWQFRSPSVMKLADALEQTLSQLAQAQQAAKSARVVAFREAAAATCGYCFRHRELIKETTEDGYRFVHPVKRYAGTVLEKNSVDSCDANEINKLIAAEAGEAGQS